MTYTINARTVEALHWSELSFKEQLRADWIEEELGDFLRHLETGINSVEYINIGHYIEYVRVYYKGGGHCDVNITMDSKAAIVEDIYRQGAIY